MRDKVFALIDCNAFYVSCERVFNPKLNNRPVVATTGLLLSFGLKTRSHET